MKRVEVMTKRVKSSSFTMDIYKTHIRFATAIIQGKKVALQDSLLFLYQFQKVLMGLFTRAYTQR